MRLVAYWQGWGHKAMRGNTQRHLWLVRPAADRTQDQIITALHNARNAVGEAACLSEDAATRRQLCRMLSSLTVILEGQPALSVGAGG
jgi:hypothetical protein